MLGSLHGTVTGRLDNRALIEVRDVGYWVHTGSWQPEGEVTCYLHHHVREDAEDLYGFPDLSSLTLFERLIAISGIGPKAGMALLSIGSVERIGQAIQEGDASFLSSAPGIGSKAAQKIILELRGKLPELDADGPTASHLEVLGALESLGYKAAEVRDTLKSMPPDLQSADARIKWALQQLGR